MKLNRFDWTCVQTYHYESVVSNVSSRVDVNSDFYSYQIRVWCTLRCESKMLDDLGFSYTTRFDTGEIVSIKQ